MEVTNTFNHLKWVWSEVLRIIKKKQVRMNLGMKFIRMNLGMKLIFCMWSGIHKYIYLIQSIQMDVVRHKCNSQY